MQTTSNNTVCPFCETRQPVPEDTTEDGIFCQKCGNRFPVAQEKERKTYPLLGKLAVSYQYISAEDLDKALSIKHSHKQKGKKISLAEIFVKYEMLTPKQMGLLYRTKEYLESRQLDKKFADMATSIKPSIKKHVEKALSMQARMFKEKKVIKQIGDILVTMEAMTTEERDTILFRQNRMKDKAHPQTILPDKKEPIALIVSKDGMEAVLRILENPKQKIVLDQIKTLLKEKEIAYGVTDDDTINKFLSANGTPRELVIARGKPQVPCRDAYIKSHFDENHLRAGEIDSEGNIDFKNRGDIPFVKAGDILVEKISLQEGSDGIDIFGNSIIADKARDIDLVCGTGVKISEDKMTVFAETDGQPLISLGGKISVLKEKIISGDVDYNTGHVKFDGNVIIKGMIQNGFRVTSANLRVQEISGGIVDSDGDVSVSGGIIDATIHAKGNVYATYIKNAKIISYGNLMVKKEILDSEITLAGFCQVQTGNILSSLISAKKGIQSVNIGNETSQPNMLKVGIDDHVEKESQHLDTLIAEKKEKQHKLDTDIKEYIEKHNVIHNMISEIAHEKNRAAKERDALDTTLQRFSRKKAKRNLAHAAARLQELDEKIKSLEETIKSLYTEQDGNSEKHTAAESKSRTIENEIAAFEAEKKGLISWSKQEKPIPVVKVTGTISDRTIISSRHAKKILNETYKNVHLREVKASFPQSDAEFEIQIVQNQR